MRGAGRESSTNKSFKDVDATSLDSPLIIRRSMILDDEC
jgi:hypothetical protein